MRTRLAAAAIAVAGLVGGAAGAGVYALFSGDGGNVTTVALSRAPNAATTPAARVASLGLRALVAAASPGAVEVTATSADAQNPLGGAQEAQGSGFVVDVQGHVVTNYHVVANASSVGVAFSDGSTYRATVVGTDASTDLAVLKVAAPTTALHPLRLADSAAVAAGDTVVAIGSPFGLENSITTGIVSAVGREISGPEGSPIENAIQTDAAVNHGNSGGPLLDVRGEVVGVTSQIESDSGGNDGVGFSVPSNTVQKVVRQLIATGKARHALLGVQVQTLPPNVAATLGAPAGAAVTSVQTGSGAAKAGLTSATGTRAVAGTTYPAGGDVVTAVGETKVSTAEQLRGAISIHEPGDVVTLTVTRAGKTRTLDVTLGSR
jgi:putative serine protease PepD